MTTMKLGRLTRTLPRFGRSGMVLSMLGACMLLGSSASSQAQRVFSETFDELPLGPNQEEALAGANVWGKTPPTGWTIDDSKMPGVSNVSSNGITEWAGWSFANKNWWVQTAGDQRRSEFSFGQGTVLIADPDEWDDATHAPGLFESTITTAPIGITNSAANTLVLVYDSSWRPEAVDDGAPNFPVNDEGTPINDQTGYITVSYDGGAATEVQRWTSINDASTYHDHNPNESVIVPLSNPAGAQNLVLKVGMEKAANDWWWAVDNFAIGVPPFATSASSDGVSFTVRIVEALGKSVDQAKGVTVQLDGQAVTPVTLTKEGDYLLVKYAQADVFEPGKVYSVKLNYTSNDGKALEDTVQFVGPSYATAAATPTTVRVTLTDTEVVKIDETKGLQFELDGKTATGSTPSRTDTAVTSTVTVTEPFASNSEHTLNVTFTTATGKKVVNPIRFTSPPVVTLPTAIASDVGTGSGAGMRWKTYQLAAAPSPSGTAAVTEDQLAGKLGPSIHETAGQGADGYFPIDFVNFEQAAGELGNFKASGEGALQVEDRLFPGVSGANGDDNIAGEALAFIELPQAGVYQMGVNSDDGFQVTAGTTNNPTQVALGKFDSTRGAADTLFYFRADRAGVYLFRLIYWEVGGGAGVEWFTVNPDGTRALVGGSQTGALKAFRTRTGAEPNPGEGGIQSVQLSNGSVVITYSGTLRSSATVNGAYAPVANATSPYTVSPSAAAQFYIAQ